MTLMTLMWIAACVPEVKVDDSDPSADDSATDDSATDDSGAPTGQRTAVIGTTADDYSVGALSTVSLDGWSVSDGVIDTASDHAVVVSGGYVFQLDRFGYDTVQIFTPGDWSAPAREFALEDQANPHDVEVCGGEAFITQYGLNEIIVYDPESGAALGAVDLSAFEEGDGTPEASTMVQAGGKLYVGLQNLDRNAGWVESGGHLVEVDCGSREVTNSWALSGQVNVFAHPDPNKVLIVDTYAGLYELDASAGQLSALLLDQVAEGVTLLDLAAYGDGAVALYLDSDYNYAIGCVSLSDWSLTLAETSDAYLAGISGNDRGEAWISARTHWSLPTAATGAIVYDIERCSALTTDGPIGTLLSPSSIAFY